MLVCVGVKDVCNERLGKSRPAMPAQKTIKSFNTKKEVKVCLVLKHVKGEALMSEADMS